MTVAAAADVPSVAANARQDALYVERDLIALRAARQERGDRAAGLAVTRVGQPGAARRRYQRPGTAHDGNAHVLRVGGRTERFVGLEANFDRVGLHDLVDANGDVA